VRRTTKRSQPVLGSRYEATVFCGAAGGALLESPHPVTTPATTKIDTTLAPNRQNGLISLSLRLASEPKPPAKYLPSMKVSPLNRSAPQAPEESQKPRAPRRAASAQAPDEEARQPAPENPPATKRHSSWKRSLQRPASDDGDEPGDDEPEEEVAPREVVGGRVTAIESQKRTRKYLGTRVNVFLDDAFGFAIDAELARAQVLRIGRELSREQVEELLRLDGEARALAKALNFIGFRPRSTREVRDRLKRDGCGEDVIERVVQRLQKMKALGDAEFAQAWVESRTVSKPRGPRALQQELRQKGVGREEIDVAVSASMPDAQSEVEVAVAALQTKTRTWERLEGRDREQKMLGFLQRRGFGFSSARSAIKQFDEEDEN
jgi:regulatory protein